MATKLHIPFKMDEQVIHLVSLLLQHNVTNGQLEIDIASDKKDSLIQKLEKFNIYPNQKEEAIPNGLFSPNDAKEVACEEIEASEQPFQISKSQIELPKEERGERRITDPYLFSYLMLRDTKMRLNSIAEKFEISLEVIDRSLVITGHKKKVEDVYERINRTIYEKSVLLPKNEAWCLMATTYIHDLQSKYQTVVRPINEGEKMTRLVVFGDARSLVEECKQALEKVAGKIIIMLEVGKEYELEGEIDEIFKYIKDKYYTPNEEILNKKAKQCEIRKFTSESPGKHTIFFFINTAEEKFAKLQNYLLKEAKSLCIVNIYPKKMCRLSIDRLVVSSLEEKVRILELRSDHYLLLGKLKRVKPLITRIMNLDGKNIQSIKLRVKKTPNLIPGTLSINNLAVSLKHDPYFYLFLVTISESSKHIEDLLAKLETVFKDGNISYGSGDTSMLNLNESARLEYGDDNHSEEKTNNNILDSVLEEDETQIKLINKPKFSEANRNEVLFTFEGNQDFYQLQEESHEYKRLADLLKKGYPEARIDLIGKFFTEDLWKQYVTERSNYDEKEVVEYLLFLQSREDFSFHLFNPKDPKLLEGQLIESFNPNKHQCYEGEDHRNIVVYACLFDKKSMKLICCYPAYCFEFI